MTAIRSFLLGALIGVLFSAGVFTELTIYTSVNTRLSAIEGYIRGLDQFLRSGGK